MNLRHLFQTHLAPTSEAPISLHITHAEGNYLYNTDQKFLDLIGGISVCNLGHQHPKIIKAIKDQVDQYLHVMVYGELILSPQVEYANLLCECLGAGFDGVYFTNSGSEAIEAAMKLAKKQTGRTKIFGFQNAYHGSTQGALSMIGDEYWRQSFRPLLPETYHFEYNGQEVIESIDHTVAAVIVEPIQAESGIQVAQHKWLNALAQQCKNMGTLLIFDEVQTGFGRTGHLFAFQGLEVTPDIIVLGKALGAGMPLGAISATDDLIRGFGSNPTLGHITTFGGHPVSCAAGLASLQILREDATIYETESREKQLGSITHPNILSVHTAGVWAAILLVSEEKCLQACQLLLDRGIFTDWFLFAQNAIRVSPPLTITEEEIDYFIKMLYEVLDLI